MATNIRINTQVQKQDLEQTVLLLEKLQKNANLSKKETADLRKRFQSLGGTLGTTNQRLAGMEGHLGRLRGLTSGLGAALGVTFGAAILVRGIGAGIRKMAEFEQEMTRVKSLTSSTQKEFKALNTLAQDLGRSTIFTAKQAAEGMAFLAQAGFKTKQIMGSMKDTLNLAAAAQLDLGTSADIVTNIMSGFGLTASELGGAVDVLTRQFTSSNTNLQQLGQAMKFAAPVAKGFGVEVTTTAAALGFLADAGLQGTLGGTGFRKVLSELVKEQKKLGIQVLDSTGKMIPFADIIQQLEENGFTAAEAMAVFGDRGGPALQILLGRGSEALRTQIDLLGEGKTAAKLAAEQMDTLSGDVKTLNSAWEGLVLTEGGRFNPVLRKTVQLLTELLHAFYSVEQEGRDAGRAFLDQAEDIDEVLFRMNDLNALIIESEKLKAKEIAKGGQAATESHLKGINRELARWSAELEILTDAFNADQVEKQNKRLEKQKKALEAVTKATEDLLKKREGEIGIIQDEIKADQDRLDSVDDAIDKEIELEEKRQEKLKNIRDEARKEEFESQQEQAQQRKELEEKVDEEIEENKIAIKLQSADFVQSLLGHELSSLQKKYQDEIKAAGDNADKKAQIEEEFNKKIGAAKVRQAIGERVLALFRIYINTAAGIAKLLAFPGLPFAAPLIAQTKILAGIQTATVLAAPLPTFHKGGKIKGQGEVPILAQEGEFMLKRSVTSALGDSFLNRLNDGKVVPVSGEDIKMAIKEAYKEQTKVALVIDEGGQTAYTKKGNALSVKKVRRFSTN